MTTSPCFADLDDELAATRRMLERYPDGKGAWRPHAKSRTLAELASHVADLPSRATNVITTDVMDIATRTPKPPVDGAAQLLAAFDAAAAAAKAAISGASEAQLDKEWTMQFGERVIVRAKKRDLVRRMMLSHMIHHRAQLGDYYRQLDVPVPGMYGPSADDAPLR
jgi:uncharacterized damage-inducible protein DinB